MGPTQAGGDMAGREVLSGWGRRPGEAWLGLPVPLLTSLLRLSLAGQMGLLDADKGMGLWASIACVLTGLWAPPWTG